MAQLTANFEAGTNGNNILAVDPGSANAWDTVSTPGTSTLTYDNTHAAHGTLACKVTHPDTTQGSALVWSTSLGTVTDHFGRIYVYFTANPSIFFDILRVLNTGAHAVVFAIGSTGKLLVSDSADANIITTTNSIALNQWARIEYHITHSTTVGQVEVKLFNTTDSAIPTETLQTAANKNLLANADSVEYGARSNQSTGGGTYWLDDIIANATSYPGPIASTAAPSGGGPGGGGIPGNPPALWNAPQRPAFPQAPPPPLWNKASD